MIKSMFSASLVIFALNVLYTPSKFEKNWSWGSRDAPGQTSAIFGAQHSKLSATLDVLSFTSCRAMGFHSKQMGFTGETHFGVNYPPSK